MSECENFCESCGDCLDCEGSEHYCSIHNNCAWMCYELHDPNV